MKKQFLKTIIFSCLIFNSLGQIKVINNGYVAIGINYPNYPLHAYGWAQLFNDNGMEIKFRANNGWQSDIGSSNSGLINFWNANCWANGGWNKLKANAFLTTSDIRLKQNIQPMVNSLSKIKQLTPKRFRFKDSLQTLESEKFHFGFIAQDIMQVLPTIVDTSRGAFGVNYIEIIPFLVGAVKEQASTIDSLRAAIQGTNTGSKTFNTSANNQDVINQLNELKQKLSYFENNCCTNLGTSNVALNNNILNSNNNLVVDDIQLQNVPNPFENKTTIKFSIPTKLNGSFLIKIYKITGEELMSYKIDKTQKEILIDASQLVNGVYNYALINNNEILKMKQMILSR